MALFEQLVSLVSKIDVEDIPSERKKTLQPLIDYIQDKHSAGDAIRINFICTHNSRRSHLSQVWAQAMAHHFSIQNVTCYSGGTESTALFPEAAHSLQRVGFLVSTISDAPNPVYTIKYAENENPVIGFSKKYDDNFNPGSEFAAVMTCSQADGACPFIAGAEKRIPITYLDPKAFDDTPQQAAKYDERSLQIATEMCYVFSQVKAQ
jgi:arsenate reductase